MSNSTFLRCPYCHSPLDADVSPSCTVCAAPHHQECLDENEGCAVLGCAGGPGAAAPAATEGPAAAMWVDPAARPQWNDAPAAASNGTGPVPAAPVGWGTPGSEVAAAAAGALAASNHTVHGSRPQDQGPLPGRDLSQPARATVPQSVPVPAPSPAVALTAHPMGTPGWYEVPGRGLVYGALWIFVLPAPGPPPSAPATGGSL